VAQTLVEPLGGAVGLLEAVSFKEAMENVRRNRTAKVRTLEGSEFQTVGGATMLKPREAKIVQTRRTDSRLVLAENDEISYYTVGQ